ARPRHARARRDLPDRRPAGYHSSRRPRLFPWPGAAHPRHVENAVADPAVPFEIDIYPYSARDADEHRRSPGMVHDGIRVHRQYVLWPTVAFGTIRHDDRILRAGGLLDPVAPDIGDPSVRNLEFIAGATLAVDEAVVENPVL